MNIFSFWELFFYVILRVASSGYFLRHPLYDRHARFSIIVWVNIPWMYWSSDLLEMFLFSSCFCVAFLTVFFGNYFHEVFDLFPMRKPKQTILQRCCCSYAFCACKWGASMSLLPCQRCNCCSKKSGFKSLVGWTEQGVLDTAIPYMLDQLEANDDNRLQMW